MKKPRKSNNKTAETIYEASVKLFSENGFTGTTMRDIAKAVGILPGSLYAHINSKDEILSEIVESGINKFLSIQDVIAESTDSVENKLKRAINIHVAVVAEDPEKMLIVFHQWRYLSGEKRDRAVKMRRDYASMYVNILKQGIKEGVFRDVDVKVEVFSILGALNWIPEWFQQSGEYTAELIGQKIAETFLRGLLK